MFFSELIDTNYCKENLSRDAEIEIFSIIKTIRKNSVVYVKSKEFLEEALKNKNISLVITEKKLEDYIPKNLGLYVTESPEKDFYTYRNVFRKKNDKNYPSIISDKAKISSSAIISKINVIISDGVIVDDNVVIKSNVKIDKNAYVGPGVILGGEGLMVARSLPFNQVIEHDGYVEVGENVVIQSGTNIDKGIFGWNTVVEAGSILDSHIHIAHGVRIGKNTIIAANSMISGFVNIEDNVFIGPSVTISPFLTIGNKSRITIGSTIVSNVGPGQTYTGYFGQKHSQFLKKLGFIARGIR